MRSTNIVRLPDADPAAAADPARVLVASDLLLCRQAVAAALGNAGFTVVAQVRCPDAVEAARRTMPQAVLLDASRPQALGVAAGLRRALPAAPVIGYAVDDEEAALAAAEAGLIGFVGSEATPAELAEAVRGALAGEVRCSPRLAALLCRRVATLSRGGNATGSVPLTRREAEVAELVARGLSNKQIAQSLGIGPATVKNHVHHLLDKLAVARRGAIGTRLRDHAGVPMPVATDA